MKPISYIKTPFHEKFGVPRQSLLIKEATGKMVFPKNDFYVEAFRGLENFSHLWLIFEFNLVEDKNFSALVRPPRFEGKKKLGLYATRSPHRPNRIGLSVVEFDRVEINDNEVVLWVRGVDLVDGTPVFDIKPYIPYADSIPDARAELFEEKPISHKVIWQAEVPSTIKNLIEQVIALDPRPGHEKDSTEEYGVSIAGWNVRFKKEGDSFLVLTATPM